MYFAHYAPVFGTFIKYSSLNGGLKINLIFSLELTQM